MDFVSDKGFHHSPASLNIKDPTLPLMTVSFVTCGDHLDEEKDQFLPMC